MKAILAVAAGGAFGAAARYLVYQLSHHYLGQQFPYATLIVNVSGSLLMGMLVAALALVWNPGETTRLFLAVGVLGAFTTFSTFALDYALLYRHGELLLCALYVALSVSLSIMALFSGMALARLFLG